MSKCYTLSLNAYGSGWLYPKKDLIVIKTSNWPEVLPQSLYDVQQWLAVCSPNAGAPWHHGLNNQKQAHSLILSTCKTAPQQTSHIKYINNLKSQFNAIQITSKSVDFSISRIHCECLSIFIWGANCSSLEKGLQHNKAYLFANYIPYIHILENYNRGQLTIQRTHWRDTVSTFH